MKVYRLTVIIANSVFVDLEKVMDLHLVISGAMVKFKFIKLAIIITTVFIELIIEVSMSLKLNLVRVISIVMSKN